MPGMLVLRRLRYLVDKINYYVHRIFMESAMIFYIKVADGFMLSGLVILSIVL